MKKIFTMFLVGSVFLLSSFVKQNSIDEVIGALRSGNSAELSRYFDDNIELTLPDKSDSYSKAQTQHIGKDFVRNNGVNCCDSKHKGDAHDGHNCIGTLQTNSGSFRTHILMKTKNGKELVREIRFQAIE